ncbi:class I SAM-dependent DNA methyltransferase [Providencia rettgeri]
MSCKTDLIKKMLNIPSEHTVYHQIIEGGDSYIIKNGENIEYLICYLVKDNIQVAEDILKNHLNTSSTVSVGVIIDSQMSILKIIRKSFRTGDFDYVANLNSISSSFYVPPIKVCELKPLNTKVENVFFEIHSTLRDIDGLHAPEALEEICKLIYTKLYDEENSEKTGVIKFQRNGTYSIEECAAEIRKLYCLAIDDDKAIFINKIPTYERSRGVFKSTLKLSSVAIVRAVEILQYFDMSRSPIDIKGRAFQNVLLPAVRSGMGQYFTPKEIIDFIVDLMKPNVRELIIDPFCGSGHFLTSSIDYVHNNYGKEDKLFHEFAFTRLHGIEKSDRMVRIAMTDMRLHGDGHSNIRCTDALLPFSNYSDLYANTFDLIMTNPPFGIDLPSDSLHQIGPFELIKDGKNNISFEILALERCIQLLKPGGRLAIVLPDGVLGNKNSLYVREWLKKHVSIRAIFSLPIETFTPFGANIKTSILILRKNTSTEPLNLRDSIFLAEIENVGYDSTGRIIESSDLDLLSLNFHEFIDAEGW